MEVNEAIEFIEDSYTYLYVDYHGNKEEVEKFGEIVDLLKSLESENKKLKQYQDMWEWIQGVEMWNKEYEQVVKEVVQDIEVGYKTGKTIEQIGYEKVEDKGLTDGISNKQNQKYIKKINTFEKLKQENEAYKGMWKNLIDEINRVENDYAQRLAYGIEQRYLGGGE